MSAFSTPIDVKAKSGPVGLIALLSGVSATATWLTWPEAGSYWQEYVLSGLLTLGTVAATLKTCALLVTDYRNRKHLELAQIVTEDHGSAREASWEEIAARGMDDPASGRFLGLHSSGRPVFTPPRTPFMLVEMPPGVGKTVRLVVGNILHLAQSGSVDRPGPSLVIPDVKLELAPMLVPAM